MPIVFPRTLRQLTRDEFGQLDYVVMAQAFACQNDLGRLCDEEAYKRDLASRLNANGMGPALIEQPLSVEHGSFRKLYKVDLIVSDAAIYELKAVTELVREHEGQLLNYLLLCDQPHGKLVNFRSERVTTRFVNSSVDSAKRHLLDWKDERWQPSSTRCWQLRQVLAELLDDWGGFLELPLYTAGLVHFLGGEFLVTRRVPLSRNNASLGHQTEHLLTPEIAFRITALTADHEQYESHLRRLLRLTPLRAIHWINLSFHSVELTTIELTGGRTTGG